MKRIPGYVLLEGIYEQGKASSGFLLCLSPPAGWVTIISLQDPRRSMDSFSGPPVLPILF